MRPEDVIQLLRQQPFQPFRMWLSDGAEFEIRHPEMVQVGKSTMTIFTYLSNEPEEAKEQQVEVSLLLTESVEPLDPAPRPQGA